MGKAGDGVGMVDAVSIGGVVSNGGWNRGAGKDGKARGEAEGSTFVEAVGAMLRGCGVLPRVLSLQNLDRVDVEVAVLLLASLLL